eukprot:scaffold11520_cov106-Amphora_coffeaeformis.AAC.4
MVCRKKIDDILESRSHPIVAPLVDWSPSNTIEGTNGSIGGPGGALRDSNGYLSANPVDPEIWLPAGSPRPESSDLNEVEWPRQPTWDSPLEVKDEGTLPVGVPELLDLLTKRTFGVLMNRLVNRPNGL